MGSISFWPELASKLFYGRGLAIFGVTCVSISTLLIWPGLVEYFTTGKVYVHWSRILVATFGFLACFQAMVTGVLLQVIRIWQYQHVTDASDGDADAPRENPWEETPTMVN